MKNLNSYFIDNNLFDLQKLKQHCEHNLVKLHQSTRLPHLSLLHYADACQYDKTWTYFSKRCRGLIVDHKNKKLLAIPFFKFFNVEESLTPSMDTLEKLGAFWTTEKLDGSMIIAFYDIESGQYLMTTKGSFDSEHGAVATSIFPPQLKDKALVQRHTLMFELIDAKFRIVVDYKLKGYAPGLYLIGVRDNLSERLLTCDEVIDFAKKYNLNTYKVYPFESLDQAINNAKQLPFMEEGYVIRIAFLSTDSTINDSSEQLRKCTV